MNNDATQAISPEWEAIDQKLTTLLARVERRLSQKSDNMTDVHINDILSTMLNRASAHTKAYLQTAYDDAHIATRGRRLAALSDNMQNYVGGLLELADVKGLSPLFNRQFAHEYEEYLDLMGEMSAAIGRDSEHYNEEVRRQIVGLSPLPQANSETKVPKPFEFVMGCALAPLTLAFSFASGFFKGFSNAVTAEEKMTQPTTGHQASEPTPPTKPTRHLYLVKK